jgi:hemerythrin superfamily protein
MAHEGDVIQVLVTDHREVEAMFGQLEQLPSTDPQRRDIVDDVIKELVRHSVAEEAYVYPAYREKLPDGDKLADQETAEHAAAERTMKELESLEPTDPRFDPLVRELMTSIRAHIDEEENEAFPRLRAASTPDELDALARKVNAIKRVAPTRPHPSVPDKPLVHKVLGPGAGLVDRIRDFISGRGSD